MHLLSAIWVIYQSIPNNLPPDAGKKLDGFIKIAVPLLCALVPTTAAAVIKWLQDHDRRRRRAALTDDLTKLAKSLAELPQAPEFEAVERMRLALHAEMELGVRDLLQMQAHTPRRPVGVSSIVPGLKAMFLWWRPRGFAAWMLHLAFYGSLVFLAFMTLGMSVDSSEKKAQMAQQAMEAKLAPTASPETQKPPVAAPTSALTVVIIFVLLGVPPLIFRHLASGIHRRQCLADAARAEAIRVAAGVASPAVGAVG